LTPNNANVGVFPQGGNNYRLLGVVKGLRVSAVGDPASMPIINSTRWTPALIVTANANVTMATATVGLYTAAAAGGTAVHAVAALTGQTTNAFTYIRATTITTLAQTAQSLFVNVGVAVATGTVDVYLYGYDLSDFAQ
jgi:predicted RNA polymerase sigma factor